MLSLNGLPSEYGLPSLKGQTSRHGGPQSLNGLLPKHGLVSLKGLFPYSAVTGFANSRNVKQGYQRLTGTFLVHNKSIQVHLCIACDLLIFSAQTFFTFYLQASKKKCDTKTIFFDNLMIIKVKQISPVRSWIYI